ncbi:MAG: hypothetical protein AAF693_20430 [Bacteroidota bacterium]
MLKSLLLSTIICCSTLAFGQTVIKEIDLNLKSGGSGFFFGIGVGDAEIIPFVENNLKNLLCVRDKEKIILMEITDNFELTNKIEATLPLNTTLEGGILKSNRLSLIHSRKKKKVFIVQDTYLDGRPSNQTSFELTKKEKFVNLISDNNRCYLLTADKNTSLVNIYSFEDDNYSKKLAFELDPVQVNGAT